MQTIAELRSKAAELRKVAATLESAANALAQLGESNGSAEVAESASRGRDLSKLSGVDAIFRVLSESSTPLNKNQISAILSARGKAIGENTLQSYLSRDVRFASQGKGRWTLANDAGR